jgi:hypothetical protein
MNAYTTELLTSFFMNRISEKPIKHMSFLTLTTFRDKLGIDNKYIFDIFLFQVLLQIS